MTDLALRTYRWLGLEFQVPSDWEIVRHTTNAERGSLVLIDRRRQRLELRWSECPKKPDLERLVSDFQGQVQKGQGRRLPVQNGFYGLESRAPQGDLVTRAVRWEANAGRLIELSIVRGEGDPEKLLSCLLAGVQSGAPGEAERYSAFDVDVELPPGLRIAGATVKPADVLLEFEPPGAKPGQHKKPRAIVHRFGMADAWFSGDLYALIRREEPKSRLEFSQREIGPHAALFACGAEGPPLPRLLGFAPQKRLLAWACSEKNSLFVVATSSKRKAPLLPEQLHVHCCGALA